MRELRLLADAIEVLEPGPAVIAFPLLFKQKGALHMGVIQVVDTEAGLSAVVGGFVDSEGNAADGVTVTGWSSSDETVASVTPSEDLSSATFVIGGPGVALIEVTAVNADGVAVAPSQGTITVVPGDAVIGSVEFAVAEPAPTP